MIITTLLKAISFPYVKSHPLRFVLCVIGIALGVGVFTAIRLANTAALSGFSNSQKLLGNSNQLSIVGPGPIPENVIPKLNKLSCVEKLNASSSHYATAYGGDQEIGVIELVGADLFGVVGENANALLSREDVFELLTDSRSIALSPTLIEKLAGRSFSIDSSAERIKLHPKTLQPSQFSSTDTVALMDIAHFQHLFKNYGTVDHLSFTIAKRCNNAEVLTTVSSLLPPNFTIDSSDTNTELGSRMTEAFRLNITFLALMALLVAVFLMYNTMSYAVLRRRADLGSLIALGLSPRSTIKLITIEGLITGILGSAVGLFLGYFLAQVVLFFVTKSISALYLPTAARSAPFTLGLFIECAVIGPIVGLIGSLVPAMEAAWSPTRTTFSYQNFEAKFRELVKLLSIIGLLFLSLGYLLSGQTLLHISLLFGFVPPILVSLGISLLCPALILGTISAFRTVFGKSLDILLAANHLQETLRRSSAAAAAIVVTIGMFIGLSTLIGSFRTTVSSWIDTIIQADLYISAKSSTSATHATEFLPGAILEKLKTLEGVKAIDTATGRNINLNGRTVRVVGTRTDLLGEDWIENNSTTHAPLKRLNFTNRLTSKELKEIAGKANQAFISETFANRFGAKLGSTITIPGIISTQNVTVAGIFRDYSNEQGLIYINTELLVALDGAGPVQAISIYLQPAFETGLFKNELLKVFPNYNLNIRENRELRKDVLTIFDQTFRVTYALQFITLLVSTLALVSTLFTMMLDRIRDFAVLSAIGASYKALQRIIITEAILLGTAAMLGGLLLGASLSWLLVFSINRYFFGWSVELSAPWLTIAMTGIFTLLLSVCCAVVPARSLKRKLNAAVLRYE